MSQPEMDAKARDLVAALTEDNAFLYREIERLRTARCRDCETAEEILSDSEDELERLRAKYDALWNSDALADVREAKAEIERLRAALDQDKAGMYAAGLELQARLAEVRVDVLLEVRDALVKHSGEPMGRLGAIQVLRGKIPDFPPALAAAQPKCCPEMKPWEPHIHGVGAAAQPKEENRG